MGEWRKIPGFTGYEISRMGEIRSFRGREKGAIKDEPTMISPFRKRTKNGAQRGGRIVHMVADDGKKKLVSVISVMVMAWMNGGEPGKIPYHKNGDLTDDCLHNIAVATKKEVGKKTGGKGNRKPVQKIDRNGEVVEFYRSAREAGKKNYISETAILERCRGKVREPFRLDGFTYRYDR